MFLFFLFFLDISIKPFETSQRLKGLGVHFSRIITDTITDLIYNPGTSRFLSHPLLMLEFGQYTYKIPRIYGETPIYRVGYFVPSILRNFSYTIYSEGVIENFEYYRGRVYTELNYRWWNRSILSLSYQKKDKIFSIGGDVLIGRENESNWEEHIRRISNYIFFVSFIKKNTLMSNLKYQKKKNFYYYWNTSFHSQSYRDTLFNSDTLIIIRDRIYKNLCTIISSGRDLTSLYLLDMTFNISPRKRIYLSFKVGENENIRYYNHFDELRVKIITKTWKDSLIVESDTFSSIDTLVYEYEYYKPKETILGFTLGIGGEIVKEKTKLLYGAKFSYYYIEPFFSYDTLYIPLGIEYKASKKIDLRFGITIVTSLRAGFYDSPSKLFHLQNISNAYYFGIRFFPIKKFYIDLSNNEDLVKLEDWEIGVVKSF